MRLSVPLLAQIHSPMGNLDLAQYLAVGGSDDSQLEPSLCNQERQTVPFQSNEDRFDSVREVYAMRPLKVLGLVGRLDHH